jgi:hypothetical protein
MSDDQTGAALAVPLLEKPKAHRLESRIEEPERRLRHSTTG